MEIFRLSVEILGLVLGLAAILLAIKHLRGIEDQRIELKVQAIALTTQAAQLDAQLNSQAAKLDAQAAKLEETQRSLSTRYIGEFPEYLPLIVSLIKQAQKEVLVFCDIPAYGHFSDYTNWLEYRYVIEKQSGKIPVSLTCLNKEWRNKTHDEQFTEKELAWDEWKKEAKIREQLQRYLQINSRSVNVETLSKQEFADMVEETDNQMLSGVFATCDIMEVAAYIPLYFWLVDKKEAIFTIPSYSNKHSEYGFFTSDPRLISAFIEMKERYHREATQGEN